MAPKQKPLTPQWNQLILEAICLTRTSPPPAARAIAMIHTAIYDAWSVFDNNALSTSTADYIKWPEDHCEEEEIRKAISYAAYRVLQELFWIALPGANKNLFRDFMIENEYDPDDCSIDTCTPEGIGNLMAKLVVDSHKGDGSNPSGIYFDVMPWGDYTDYKSVNPAEPQQLKDVNYWQPLLVNNKPQTFLLPHWSLTKPFALPFAARFRPKEPFRYPSHDFNHQLKEVIEFSKNLTPEHKAISEYWADGPGTYTPPGHWCSIAQYVASDTCKNYDEKDCVKMFFTLGNALLDASIACWECKRKYSSVRPITAVRKLYYGKTIEAWAGPNLGTQPIQGQHWKPFQTADLVTPAFPEHASGHSTFSMAAACILKNYTGSDTFEAGVSFKKGESQIEPGLPEQDVDLSWKSFSEMALQAGLSRVYGGIHFKKGNEDGLKMGEEVGKCVWDKVQFFFNLKK